MQKRNKITALDKTASVLYFLLAFAYGIACGGVILAWILTIMGGTMIGGLNIFPMHAVFLIMVVLIWGFIVISIHAALVLREPGRGDKAVYYLYQAAGFSFAVIDVCVGIVFNTVGLMGVALSFLYYGIMFTLPVIGGIAMGFKRRECVVVDQKSHEHGIIALNGDYRGAFFPISGEEMLVLGTSPRMSNILFSDSRISRRHCTVQFWQGDGQYYIIDYSTNGVYLKGGARIPKGTSYACPPGTVFSMTRNGQMFQVV